MGSPSKKIRCGRNPLSVIILAGGRGSRMKAEKAGLAVGRRTLFEHVLGQIEPFFDEILISVSPGQTGRFKTVSSDKGLKHAKPSGAGSRRTPRIVTDIIPGLGPLGGILAGLKEAKNEACLVVACDIPEIHIPLLRTLARAAQDAEIAVPVGPTGHYEPLLAIYRKTVIPEVEGLLRSGERSILPLLRRCKTSVVKLGDASWLRNLNTPEDYRRYVRAFRTRLPAKGILLPS